MPEYSTFEREAIKGSKMCSDKADTDRQTLKINDHEVNYLSPKVNR